MQLTQKQKTFLNFFMHFGKLDPILNISRKSDDPHSWCIFELAHFEKRG